MDTLSLSKNIENDPSRTAIEVIEAQKIVFNQKKNSFPRQLLKKFLL